jgi:methyltransferase
MVPTMRLAYLIISVVALQRTAELIYASRNATALKKSGGIEVGRQHYPAMMLLHASWLVATALGVRHDSSVRIGPLVAFASLQVLRLWVIATLGPFWTTRIITVPGQPLIESGPYRYVRHPNYLVVAGEMALLPLVFGQIANAIIFSVLNAGILAWRIRTEDAALAPRRRA